MGSYIAVEEDVRLFVEDFNPGNGKPIVFIHGWPLNHKIFEYQFNQLPKEGYRCIGVDLRGFGKSDKPWKGYSYNRLAKDIRIVVDTLGLSNFALVGWSVGGAIAVRYMARYAGNNVSKLALLGAAAPVFTQRPGYPYGLTKEAVNHLIEGTYRNRPKMLDEFDSMVFARPVQMSFQNWVRDLGLEASGNATAKVAISLRDEDLREDLHAIHVPTGIFHGRLDKVCPFELAELLHTGIPGSQLVPFEHSGHALFYDELEKFNRELVRFIG